MRIATWNLRGINDPRKQQDLANDLEKYEIDLLAVQETHFRKTGELNLPQAEKKSEYTLHFTGPKDSSRHGVGIVVKKDLPAKFTRINDRICKLEVELDQIENKAQFKKRKLTLISAYAPTLSKSTKNPQLAEDFYTALQNTVNSVPNRHILFIGADTNAQIGTGFSNFQDSVGQFGKGFLNANGERL